MCLPGELAMCSESESFGVKDPVCGMDVDLNESVAEWQYEEYGGWAYFFCSARCRRLFLRAPHRYANGPSAFASLDSHEEREGRKIRMDKVTAKAGTAATEEFDR